MSEFDLSEVLKLCKSSASNGDKIAKEKLAHLNSSLLDAQNQVQQDIAWLDNSECSLPEMSEALKKQLLDIQSSFVSLSKVSDSDLRYLRKHLSKFSITLFGEQWLANQHSWRFYVMEMERQSEKERKEPHEIFVHMNGTDSP
jgi:hypothetical protein